MFTQAQVHLQAAEGIGVVAEGLQIGFLVAEGDLGTQGGKLFDARFVADTGPDEGHIFAGDHRPQTFDWQHTKPLLFRQRGGRPREFFIPHYYNETGAAMQIFCLYRNGTGKKSKVIQM